MGRYATFTAWYPTTGTSGAALIPFLTSTAVSTQSVSDQITRAESLIDSFVSRNYLPSAYATAPAITMVTEDIVTYRLLENYIYNTPEGLQAGVSTRISANYNTALALLEQWRDGKMEIVDSAGNVISRRDTSNKYFISTNSYSHTFNVDSPLKWTTSKTRLDDVDDAREADNG